MSGALLSAAVFYATGELRAPSSIAREQQSNGVVYNALLPSFGAVKLENLAVRKPEVIAIGTSRAMQLRQPYFSRPFYGLGGLANGVREAALVWDRVVTIHRPKLTIFVVDWWGFSDPVNIETAVPQVPTKQYSGQHTIGRFDTFAAQLMTSGRIGAASFATALFNPAEDAIGILARAEGHGFRPDGSLCYGATASYTQNDFIGDSHFRFHQKLSLRTIRDLKALTQRVQESGADFLIIAPPISPEAVQQTEALPDFAWIATWRAHMLDTFGDRFIDAHSSIELGASNTEFVDPIHPGEVAIARALLKASERYAAARPFLDIETLQTAVARGAHHVQAPNLDPECHIRRTN